MPGHFLNSTVHGQVPMATFTNIDCEKHLFLYRKKLEMLKVKKMEEYDQTNPSVLNESREEYEARMDRVIVRRINNALEKMNTILNAAKLPLEKTQEAQENPDSDMDEKFDPYDVMGLKEEAYTNSKAGSSSSRPHNNNVVDWGKLFESPDRPLVIDAGCGPGKFLLRFAWEGVARDAAISNLNFLGIEIRKGLVDMATRYRDQLKFNNVAYLHAEFNDRFVKDVLATYPGEIKFFCCQMPDPRLEKNMKRRGKKKLTLKRIIGPTLVDALSKVMDPMTGRIYVSSEYEEVAEDMKTCFLAHKDFRIATREEVARLMFLQRSTYSNRRWVEIDPKKVHRNPFGCETERELFLRKNKKSDVFRWVFSSNELNTDVKAKPCGKLRISRFLMTQDELRQTDLVAGSETVLLGMGGEQGNRDKMEAQNPGIGGLDEESIKAMDRLFVGEAEVGEENTKKSAVVPTCDEAENMV